MLSRGDFILQHYYEWPSFNIWKDMSDKIGCDVEYIASQYPHHIFDSYTERTTSSSVHMKSRIWDFTAKKKIDEETWLNKHKSTWQTVWKSPIYQYEITIIHPSILYSNESWYKYKKKSNAIKWFQKIAIIFHRIIFKTLEKTTPTPKV